MYLHIDDCCHRCYLGLNQSIIDIVDDDFREDRPSTKRFIYIEDAKEILVKWRNDYNEYRPHSALTYLPPAEFARYHAAYGP